MPLLPLYPSDRHKGRYFWNKRTAEGLKAALAYFNQAIEEDPKYTQAYSGLADTYALLGDWQYAVMTPKQALPKAKAAAIKALELDSAQGEAHNSLAFVLDGFDWDFDSGGKEFRRAIELNPGYATAHHWYAWHLSLSSWRTLMTNPYDRAARRSKWTLILLSHTINSPRRTFKNTCSMKRSQNCKKRSSCLGVARRA